ARPSHRRMPRMPRQQRRRRTRVPELDDVRQRNAERGLRDVPRRRKGLGRSKGARAVSRAAVPAAGGAASRRPLGKLAVMSWTPRERRILAGLRTPAHIQCFLDELEYDENAGIASPHVVLESGKAQCVSGVLFACAALRELGYPPQLMYIDAVTDDGHCIAVYERGGLWGGVAKSNFTTLRSRDP